MSGCVEEIDFGVDYESKKYSPSKQPGFFSRFNYKYFFSWSIIWRVIIICLGDFVVPNRTLTLHSHFLISPGVLS